jgi:hypothetical protein
MSINDHVLSVNGQNFWLNEESPKLSLPSLSLLELYVDFKSRKDFF